ncbi:hypothetical protein Q4485_08180 [Granulosicoccaceae sp. 1_MG-2023]|nr:hypothetical protein [Granulosicoccaceae sp. 1_MG-2023]
MRAGRSAVFILGLAVLLLPAMVAGALPEGEKQLRLQRADGSTLRIGTVTFEALGDGRSRFRVAMDHAQFRDYFLSMKEFKCVGEAAEIHCHLPYPYARPDTVTETDLRWLEHALLFFYKRPDEFGARLRNGIYYRLEVTERGLQGTPEAVDLDLIAAPPDDLTTAPFNADERVAIEPSERAFTGLLLE